MNSRLFSSGITLIKKSNLFARNLNGTNNKNGNKGWFGLNLYEIGDLIQEPIINNNINKGNKQSNEPSVASIGKKNKINKPILLDVKSNTKNFPLL